jgi:Transglutaminase-like superfamily
MTTSSRSSTGCWLRAYSFVRQTLRVAEITIYLIAFDVLYRVGMKWIWRTLRPRTGHEGSASHEHVAALASALNTASAFYIKPVKCLQRAVAATWYLRARGYTCLLVVGAHVARKEGHAWVEVGGEVLGDPRRLRRFFRPLARV